MNADDSDAVRNRLREVWRRWEESGGAFSGADMETAFVQALQALPEDAGVWAGYARWLDLTERPQEAERAYERAVALAPDDANLRDAYAWSLLMHGEFARGGEQLRTALGLDPDLALLLESRMARWVDAYEDDPRFADALWSAVLEAAPDEPELRLDYARYLARGRGRLEAALREVERAVRSDPENAEAWRELARLRRRRGDAAGEVLPLLERAVPLEPYAEDLVKLGAYLEELGETAAAEARYREALERDPEHMNALLRLAALLGRGGGADEARELYEHLLQLHPDAPGLAFTYARFLEEQGRLDAAEEVYRSALQRNPNAAELLDAYANFLWEFRGRPGGACEQARRAARLAPDDAGTAGNLALFCWQAGRVEEAQAAFERALALAPEHANNAANYAVFLDDVRADFDRAEAMYLRALALDPAQPERLVNYAVFLATRRGRFEAAERIEAVAQRLRQGEADAGSVRRLFAELGQPLRPG